MYYCLQSDFNDKLWYILQKYGKPLHGFKFHCQISVKYYLILFCLYTNFRLIAGKNRPNKKVGLP